MSERHGRKSQRSISPTVVNSTTEFPANQLLIHVYVPDVDATFERALALGCTVVEKPKQREGDPDRRGPFFWPNTLDL